MTSRSRSFLLASMSMIICLLGYFYMTCSNETMEIRKTVMNFEERIRSLTLNNENNEKARNSVLQEKHSLEDEISTYRSRITDKESQLKQIQTKLNAKDTEIRTLQADKKLLEQQLSQAKHTGEQLTSKLAAMEKLQKQVHDQPSASKNQMKEVRHERNVPEHNPGAAQLHGVVQHNSPNLMVAIKPNEVKHQ